MEEVWRGIHTICTHVQKSVAQQGVKLDKIHEELKQLRAECKRKEMAAYSVKSAGLEVCMHVLMVLRSQTYSVYNLHMQIYMYFTINM